ncbi:MAG: hypothetical protein LBG58_00240, partial [Planctomycetaceae bacterium]|nr:hypothetical protein [Planctomycetaceae bacterium]
PFAEGFSPTVASAISDLPLFSGGNQFPNRSETQNDPIESDSLLPIGNATVGENPSAKGCLPVDTTPW